MVDTNIWIDWLDWNVPTTLTGFLRCMHALALCDRTPVESKDKVFELDSVHPYFAQRARSYFTDYIERTFKDKPEDRAKWEGKLAAVDASFPAS